MSSNACSTESSNESCSKTSSMEYPDSVNSGKTASATPSSWHSRASPNTDAALAAGSPIVVCCVHAATRTKPWL